MDRNRCPFLVNGADQTNQLDSSRGAYHSSVLIFCPDYSVHIPDNHGDLWRPTGAYGGLRSTHGDKLYASHAHLVGASWRPE